MIKTIKIKKYSDVIEEMVAASAITPGMLVEKTSAGTVQPHSTAGGVALTMFALEDELQGKEIDDDYAAGDPVQNWVPYRGDWVYGILADGESVVIGDFLESAGDGTLRKLASGEPIAEAEEAIDLSDSSATEESGPLGYDKRIQIRVM